MPDALWELVTKCWDLSADDRPPFAVIVERLKGSRTWFFPGKDAAA
jgi:hypothetical protein